MLNIFFWIAVVCGIGLRIVDGRIISIVAGLSAGIICVEVVKFVAWFFSK